MKLSKQQYHSLPSYKSYLRMIRRHARAVIKWQKGIRTRIVLKDNYGRNILKTRRYKNKMLP